MLSCQCGSRWPRDLRASAHLWMFRKCEGTAGFTATREHHWHLARQRSAQRLGCLKCQGVSCWKTLKPAPLTLLSSQAVINYLQSHQPEITTVDWRCSFQSFNHFNFLWINSGRMFIIRIFLCYKDSWKHFFFLMQNISTLSGLSLGLLKNFPLSVGASGLSIFISVILVYHRDKAFVRPPPCPSVAVWGSPHRTI